MFFRNMAGIMPGPGDLKGEKLHTAHDTFFSVTVDDMFSQLFSSGSCLGGDSWNVSDAGSVHPGKWVDVRISRDSLTESVQVPSSRLMSEWAGVAFGKNLAQFS